MYAGSTVALLLHPFRPLLAAVDGKGMLRVHNYRHNTLANKFHISGQPAATTQCSTTCLNESSIKLDTKMHTLVHEACDIRPHISSRLSQT